MENIYKNIFIDKMNKWKLTPSRTREIIQKETFKKGRILLGNEEAGLSLEHI